MHRASDPAGRPRAHAAAPGAAPWPDKDYTGEVLAFLRETHGNIRRDSDGDFYYNSVSTISLHFLLQSRLPPQEVLWRWYLHFDRGRSESIYQTLPPQRDEEFLQILESCAFRWDPEVVRASGLVFLAQHRAEVYLALEDFLNMRMDAYDTMDEGELRAALAPRLSWSEVHLRKLVRQIQTQPLTPDQRHAVYGLFESDYLRATARNLMDEAVGDAFWKQPPPELEALGARFALFMRRTSETARRLGVYVSRQEFERQYGQRFRPQQEGNGERRGERPEERRAADRGPLTGHFAALGLTPDASLNEVKAAYRERVKQSHPDQGGEVQEFLRVQEAYEYLLTQVF